MSASQIREAGMLSQQSGPHDLLRPNYGSKITRKAKSR